MPFACSVKVSTALVRPIFGLNRGNLPLEHTAEALIIEKHAISVIWHVGSLLSDLP